MFGIWNLTCDNAWDLSFDPLSLDINDLYPGNNKVYVSFYWDFVYKDGQSLNFFRFAKRMS